MSWRGEIIGHRGSAGTAPENTIASFEAAIEAGADRVEFDVRRTIDGHAVVFHDLTVERFVPGARGRSVSRHALDEMRAIDVGAVLGRPGCFVPSLDEALEAIGRRALVNAEVKGSGADGALTLPLVISALRRHGIHDDAVVSSFHAPVMRLALDQAPDIARAYIVDARTSGDPVAAALAMKAEGLHPACALATADLVDRCRVAALRVRCWTANDEPEIRRLVTLGVDGIVTDFPARAREIAR